MSQSTIVRRKSSPCCIGCIVLLVIAIGFSAAIGIYMYRFAKDNIALVDVKAKPDPELETAPEVLLPEKVGNFRRTTLTDSLENVPDSYMRDIETSAVQVGVYQDDNANQVTVIALSTDEALKQRQMGMGPLMQGRGKANSADTGISIRDPFSGDVPQTIITWQKPNWTFMVQTSSTLGLDFVQQFDPGGEVAVEETTTDETGTTDSESVESKNAQPAEPVETPVSPAEEIAPTTETPADQPADTPAAPVPAETPAPPPPDSDADTTSPL